MKVKSISGLVYYVKDLNVTSKFYEQLGFRVGKQTESSITMYINWFWVDFVLIDAEVKPELTKEATSEEKGLGQYLYLSVDSVDDTYQELLKKNIKPSSEPTNWPWGRREFIVRDPDGYKLIFFTKE